MQCLYLCNTSYHDHNVDYYSSRESNTSDVGRNSTDSIGPGDIGEKIVNWGRGIFSFKMLRPHL